MWSVEDRFYAIPKEQAARLLRKPFRVETVGIPDDAPMALRYISGGEELYLLDYPITEQVVTLSGTEIRAGVMGTRIRLAYYYNDDRDSLYKILKQIEPYQY